MMRAILLCAGVALWLLCFGAAMVTIIPLSAVGLVAIFDGASPIGGRLQGFGFLALGLFVFTALLAALTRFTWFFAKAAHAQNR